MGLDAGAAAYGAFGLDSAGGAALADTLATEAAPVVAGVGDAASGIGAGDVAAGVGSDVAAGGGATGAATIADTGPVVAGVSDAGAAAAPAADTGLSAAAAAPATGGTPAVGVTPSLGAANPSIGAGGLGGGGGFGGGGGGGGLAGFDYGSGQGLDLADSSSTQGGLTAEDQALTPGPGGATPSTTATTDPQIAAQQVANAQGIGTGADLQSGVNSSVAGNDSVLNALKQLGATGKSLAPFSGLALAALQNKRTQSASQSLNNIAQPASSVSNQLLGQYSQGQINPSDAFQIAQTAQQQIAQAKQYYANAGLSNSSMEQNAIANIENQANAAREAAAQNLLSSGLKAAGVAQGPQMAAVQASVAADQQLQNATSSFLNALAKMNTNSTPAASTSTTSTDLGS